MDMKQLILFFLFVSNVSYSQIEIYNLGLTDTTQKVMYEYHENEFKVYGVDIDSTTLLIHDKDTLEFLNSRFRLREFHSKYDTLKLYANNVLIKKVFFEQRKTPKLNFYLGDLRDSIVTKEELIYALENKGVYASFELELVKNYARVTSIRSIFIKKDNGRIIKLERKKQERKNAKYSSWSDEKWVNKCEKGKMKYAKYGNRLNEIQMKKVQRMKRGDALCIQFVRYSGSNSCHKMVAAMLKFEIK
jgi:hypothetical protein